MAIQSGGRCRELFGPRQHRHHFRQIACAIDVDALHHSRFRRIFSRQDDIRNPHIARADRDRKRAAHRTDSPVERELADQNMPVEGLYSPHGAEDAERHGQIESAPFLANIGWRQIDRNLLPGIDKPGVDEGALDTLAALAYGRIGHAHHNRIARIAAREHIHFDVDQMGVNAVNGGAAGLEERHG